MAELGIRRGWRPRAAGCAAIAVAAAAAGAASVAAGNGSSDDRLVRISRADPVAVNGSFVSPLVERFGDVRVGRGVFVAGNTILRGDPRRRVCLGSRTNVQDNVLVLALIGQRAVRGPCGRRSTGTGKRTSLAHQAEIVNSRVGNFAFIGFRARITSSVIENGAFVLHGATIRNVRIRRDRLVPVGATITT
jgi:carbon dioxide concentrating mechanism protein CcmM